MTKQPEALFVAECIDRDNYGAASTQIEFRASKELRRLHEVNAELLEACKAFLVYASSDTSDGVEMMLAYNHALTIACAAVAKATGETE